MTHHPLPIFTSRLEHALRLAASAHRGQERRGSGTPYVTHVVAVAWILDRLGFDEDVVVAGLLHDVVEDTDTSLDDIALAFGPRVAGIVAACSERKADGDGKARPWIDRKRDHIAALADAPSDARAVVLADKLHNLESIRHDLDAGRDVWALFHADRESVLRYYREILEACSRDDERLSNLATMATEVLRDLASR